MGKDKNGTLEREQSSPSGTVSFTQNMIKMDAPPRRGLAKYGVRRRHKRASLPTIKRYRKEGGGTIEKKERRRQRSGIICCVWKY